MGGALDLGFVYPVSVSLPLAPGLGWLHPPVVIIVIVARGPTPLLPFGKPRWVFQALDSRLSPNR